MYTLPPKARFSSSVGNGLFNSASLDLPFAKTKSLVDATTGANLVDFTRQSRATYVDGEGVIRTATTNLLLQSEDFSTTWAVTRCLAFGSGSIANAIEAPDGTLTADKLVEDTTSSNTHFIFQTAAVTSGVTYAGSVYVKAAERFNVLVISGGTPFGGNGLRLNLHTGDSSVVGSPIATFINALGNGWYRVGWTIAAVSTGTGQLQVRIADDSGNQSYTGDGTSGIYIWGAQLEQSTTVGEYIPTTSTINSAPRFDHDPTTGESLGLLVEEQRTNLLLRSEELETTWTTIRASVSANAIVAPNGSLTADKLVEDSTATNTHFIRQTSSVVSGTTYTLTVFAKAAERTQVNLQLTTGFPSTTHRVDLSTGSTIDTAGSPVATSIQPVPDGWYRISITQVANLTTSVSQSNIFISVGGTTVYTGDGTSGIYLWGAQLEVGSFPTSYIPTTTAAATRAADVASISGSNFGVSRTNLLLQSEEFDNALWTGASPTVTPNAAVAPNGTTTADKVEVAQIKQTVNSVIAEDSYSISFFIKADETTSQAIRLRTGFSGGSSNFWWIPSTGLFGTVGTGFSNESATFIGDGWYRISGIYEIPAGVTSVEFAISGVNADGGGIISGYFTIWGAQLEAGSTATAYIPTTTAAVTVVESPWYRQEEGTVFAESSTFAPTSSFDAIGNIGNSITPLIISLSRNGTNSRGFGAGVSIDQGSNTYPANTTVRQVIAAKVNDFALSTNASSIAADTSTDPLPTAEFLNFGVTVPSAAAYLNGHIRRLTYWPTRLSNEVLQRITQ